MKGLIIRMELFGEREVKHIESKGVKPTFLYRVTESTLVEVLGNSPPPQKEMVIPLAFESSR